MTGESTTRNATRTVDSESDLDFIAGFPCKTIGCNGKLTKVREENNAAVVCSVCEDIPYAIAPVRKSATSR